MAARILIADKHDIWRRGVKNLLTEMHLNVAIYIEEVNNSHEAIDKARSGDFDLVLLDISIPGRNGLQIVKQLKIYNSSTQVLILSRYPEEQFAVRAFKAGADGYLSKASTAEEFIDAINTVLKGRKYITSSLADRLAHYVESSARGPRALHDDLSHREYEVLCMTASGKSVKRIAMELSLSDKTISTYRARILNKLELANIAQLIQYAVQNSLIELQK